MRIVSGVNKFISPLVKLSRGIPRSRITIALIIVAGFASGIANTVLIALINGAINRVGSPSKALVWGFVGLCIVLPIMRFLSGILLVGLTERGMFELRLQMSRRILNAPLRLLEELGSHRLLVAIASDVPTINNALTTLPLLCMQMAILFGCLVYLGWLSWKLLIGTVIFMGFGILTHQLPVSRAVKHFGRLREHTDALFKQLRSLLEGIKELKLHSSRRKMFFTKFFEPTALAMQKESIVGNRIWSAAGSWGQILFFVAIGLVLLVLPEMVQLPPRALTGYTLTILYMMGPLEFLINALPGLSRADISMKKIEALGLSLTTHPQNAERESDSIAASEWNHLEAVGITHSYNREGEESDFTLGPIDLSLRPGELVFLTGGNGSGKTTLAKLLVGLYVPEIGKILFDDSPVTNDNRDAYRQQFSVIFADYYLFENLLGFDEKELDEKAHEYLVELQLEGKVKVKDGKLSTIELSQGQRKRLTLLNAYLEDRSIYVFDEWAADQDPQFKEVFYYQILPGLKARGKTVIVITHDDRYYNLADRIVKLEYGRLEYDKPARSSAVTSAQVGAPYRM